MLQQVAEKKNGHAVTPGQPEVLEAPILKPQLATGFKFGWIKGVLVGRIIAKLKF